MTESEEQALLAEASDPQTTQERLYDLEVMASSLLFEDRLKTTPWRFGMDHPMYIHTPAFPRALLFQVARNLNIDMKIVQRLSTESDDVIMAVLNNAALPLLFLGGAWQWLSKEGVRRLRSVACGVNHPLFPILARFCEPEWRSANASKGRTVPPGRQQMVCGDASCAICYPYLVALTHRRIVLDEDIIPVGHIIGDGTVVEGGILISISERMRS